MGPLRARTTSVSLTTFVATTVVIVLWFLAILAIAMYLFLRQRYRAQHTQTTSPINRSASHGSTASRFPPSDLTALPSYPQRAYAPSHPQTNPSPLSRMTRLPDLRPTRTTSPAIAPVPPGASTRPEDFSRSRTASPTKDPFTTAAASSSNEARQQNPLANDPARLDVLARLQAIPLASDTTDMSSETADPRREVVNPGYMAMLAQRGVRARDHALLGSDDGTDDAGVGAPAGLSYAARARGVGPIGGGVDPWGNGGRFAGWGESGRAGTARVEGGEGGYGRVMPLHVRKMPSV